ncbi:MAG: AAA family ATPase [Chloroflexi bacterium]|nr:AAA family ATPase [Chloroflexota bacterium]
MNLRRIFLRDFRRFANFQASFAPGLNVIVGKNEEGKSTLREAITLGLFADPSTTKRELLGLKRWGATEQFAIELEIEEDGKHYTLMKDFQTKTGRLRDDATGEALQDAKVIDRRIKEMLGIPSQDVFESTARISHQEITNIKSGKTIADRLQELVTGGRQDVQASKVLVELDKAVKALTTRSKACPGPLDELPGQIELKETALESKRQTLSRVGEASKELSAAEEALRAAQRELEEKEATERSCRERLHLEDELARARAEENALDAKGEEARRLESAIAQAEGQLGEYAAVLGLPDEQMNEIRVLEMKVSEMAMDEPRLAVPNAAPQGMRRGLVMAGAALALAGLAAAFFNPLLIVPFLVLFVIGAAVVVWEVFRSRNAGDVTALVERMRAQERTEAAEKANVRLREMLTRMNCTGIEQFNWLRKLGEALQRSIGEDMARLEGLLSGQTVSQVDEARKMASRKARDLSERLDEPEMRLAKIDQATYLRLQKDVARLRDYIQALRERIEDIRVTVRAGQIGIEELHALEEEIQERRDRLAAAQERHLILNLTRQVLEEARAAATVSATDVLEEEIDGLIGEITYGRYSRVKVDPTSLSIALVSPESGAPIAVGLKGELSTGTVEQVYLAARLAMVKLLAQDRRPPLILDDPFLCFDDRRTAAVLALCKRIAERNQVLLFTCRDEYQIATDNVVRLPEVC